MVIIIRYNRWYYPIGSWASVECIESIAVIFLWPFGFTCEHIKNHDVINHFSSYSGSLYKYKTENHLFLHLFFQKKLLPLVIKFYYSILAYYFVESRSTCTFHNNCYVYGHIHSIEDYTMWTKNMFFLVPSRFPGWQHKLDPLSNPWFDVVYEYWI